MAISIAITGSFATGKSYVLELLENMGFKTFSCDVFVKNLYTDVKIRQKILRLLPTLKVFDKTEIAKIIYTDKLARHKIESFIHPLVLERIQSTKQQNNSEKFIFIEVPLLFESGFEQYFDYTVTMFCSEQTRLSRAFLKPNFSRKIYDTITSTQLTQDTKISKADFSINTDCTKPEIEKQILKILDYVK
jgi:dephospho-CoA kinase